METKQHKQHYKQEFSPSIPENYERYFVPAIGKPLATDLLSVADIRPGDKVLDVACGTGILARMAQDKAGPTGSIAGLDVNAGMLDVARSLLDGNKPVEWFEASAEEIPLSDAMFDVVLCQLSLQFMEDKSSALKEMKRVLLPDGRIYLNVPGIAGPVFQIFAEELERHISAEAAGFANQVFSLNDTAEIKQLFTGAGFQNIKIDKYGKTLLLPTPGEFLWQYVHATPLSMLFAEVDQSTKNALEQDIVGKWQSFAKEGQLQYKQTIIQVSATK